MRAAIVSAIGTDPEPGERPEPSPASGEVVIEVEAAALNPVDVNVALGRQYAGTPPLPYVPGCEAVGLVAGRRVWAFGGGLGLSRDGGMAERVAAPRGNVYDVPDGAEPTLAAAFGIAGVAGWMPVARRSPVRRGDTVLVLGATGIAGLVAVQAARLLGAGRVVAAGRDESRLRRAVERGADVAVVLDDDADLVERFREASGGGPTLVVDFLWGAPARAAVDAAAPGARVVHVGQSAGPEATLTSAAVRGKQLEILGFSNFGVAHDELAREYALLVEHALAGEIQLDVEVVSLQDVAGAWHAQASGSGVKHVIKP